MVVIRLLYLVATCLCVFLNINSDVPRCLFPISQHQQIRNAFLIYLLDSHTIRASNALICSLLDYFRLSSAKSDPAIPSASAILPRQVRTGWSPTPFYPPMLLRRFIGLRESWSNHISVMSSVSIKQAICQGCCSGIMWSLGSLVWKVDQ